MNATYTIASTSQLPDLYAIIQQAALSGTHTITIKRQSRQRTNPQNAALHVWLAAMADALNDAGIDQKKLIQGFKEDFELPVTEYMLKDLFREIGRIMFGKKSTADLSTTEIQDVYRVVDMRLGEITGITIPWPSIQPPDFPA